ncbi:MAG: DUF6756 family protein [Verrucomicrobiota bacterium]
MDLRHDITEAIKGRKDIDFTFVRLNRYEAILDRFAERFLIRGRQDLELFWLWTSLRHEVSLDQPEDVPATLRQKLGPMERYWFIAGDEHSKYWVAEASGSGIIKTVSEMYCFEYYIIDPAMTWMLCENHHGMLIAASADSPQLA